MSRFFGLSGALILAVFALLPLFTLSFLSLSSSSLRPAFLSPSPPSTDATDETTTIIICPHDRILVLAPHPDDETLACAGIIQKAVALNLPLKVVFLTYGDDNEWSFLVYRKFPVLGPQAIKKMGLLREKEARLATAELGVRPDQIVFLGYPDHSLESIWNEHWGNSPPAVGSLSRARQVPYPDAFRPGAPYKGEEIVEDLRSILQEFKPTKIFLSHPADNHPDHRSLYLFTRVALWDIEDEITQSWPQSPQLFPYLVHFSGWPKPKGLHQSLRLEPPAAMSRSIHWVSEPLEAKEIATKLEALKKHKSQHESAAPFLNAFIRQNELFGDFPELEVSEISQSAGASSVWLEADKLVISFYAPYVPPAEINIGVDTNEVRTEDEVHFSFRLFGYRKDVPFAKMPKLWIRVSERRAKVYDRGMKLNQASIKVRRNKSNLDVAVPLDVLASPQKVFLGTKTPLSTREASCFCWRIISLNAKIIKR
ncbi:MAG: PIG-L deacetylase family protein [Candidatus Saccharicenans sp.]